MYFIFVSFVKNVFIMSGFRSGSLADDGTDERECRSL